MYCHEDEYGCLKGDCIFAHKIGDGKNSCPFRDDETVIGKAQICNNFIFNFITFIC